MGCATKATPADYDLRERGPGMYQLQVFFAGDDFPQFMQHIASASVVLTAIHGLLAAHPGCEKVVVRLNGDRLFAVDCAGNTLP